MKKVDFAEFAKDNLLGDGCLDRSSMLFYQNESGVDGILSTYGDSILRSVLTSYTWQHQQILEAAIKKNDGLRLTSGETTQTSKNAIEFIAESIRAGKDQILKRVMTIPEHFHSTKMRALGSQAPNKGAVSDCLLEISPSAIISAANHLVDKKIIKVLDENGYVEKNKRVATATVVSGIISSYLADNLIERSFKNMMNFGFYNDATPIHENRLSAMMAKNYKIAYQKCGNTVIENSSLKDVMSIYHNLISATHFSKELDCFLENQLTDEIERNMSVDDIATIFNKCIENGINKENGMSPSM